MQTVAAPGIVDLLPLVCVAKAGGRREARSQSDGCLSEDRPAGRVDARIELNLGSCRWLIDVERLVVVFVEEKDPANPRQPRLLVKIVISSDS